MTRDQMRQAVRDDLRAHGMTGSVRAARSRLHVLNFQVVMRKLEYWQTQQGPAAKLMTVVTRLRYRRLGERYGFSIPAGAFGPGLAIVHRGTIVVNGAARVGRNCRIHHNVTIGSVRGKAPVIGDNVWIAPGAVIIGGITVGSGAAIGANSVVVADVPPNVTVAGAPARVVSEASSEQFMIHGTV